MNEEDILKNLRFLVESYKYAGSLLQNIADFHYGRGKYDFSELDEYHRNNKCFDAWEEIQEAIDEFLIDFNRKRDENV